MTVDTICNWSLTLSTLSKMKQTYEGGDPPIHIVVVVFQISNKLQLGQTYARTL